MAFLFFKKKKKKCLGVDVGASSIKIVELGQRKERIGLENYGEFSISSFLMERPFRNFQGTSLSLSEEEISKAIKAIIGEAKISTTKAIFTIPDFSTFFTYFELPPMTSKELPDAVLFEARQHIPVPLSEVTIDWSLIGGEVPDHRGKEKLQILLLAVPNEVIAQYRKIAELSKLEILALESEVFSIVRAVMSPQRKRKTQIIVDIGAQSTSCAIVDQGVLKRIHSIDVSGNELTRALVRSLNIGYKEAEDFKKLYGLIAPEKTVAQILYPLIDVIIREVERISKDYFSSTKKTIDEIILSGHSALLPGLRDYFFTRLKKEVNIANPFEDLYYPSILEDTLKEMGPGYTVPVGAALRGLEQLE